MAEFLIMVRHSTKGREHVPIEGELAFSVLGRPAPPQFVMVHLFYRFAGMGRAELRKPYTGPIGEIPGSPNSLSHGLNDRLSVSPASRHCHTNSVVLRCRILRESIFSWKIQPRERIGYLLKASRVGDL